MAREPDDVDDYDDVDVDDNACTVDGICAVVHDCRDIITTTGQTNFRGDNGGENGRKRGQVEVFSNRRPREIRIETVLNSETSGSPGRRPGTKLCCRFSRTFVMVFETRKSSAVAICVVSTSAPVFSLSKNNSIADDLISTTTTIRIRLPPTSPLLRQRTCVCVLTT